MSSKFVFRSIKPPDVMNIRSLLTKVFMASDPLARHVGLSINGFHSMLDTILPNLDHKTSIVATPREGSTTRLGIEDDDIVACLATAPLDIPIEEKKINRRALPILDLLQTSQSSFKSKVLVPNSIPESRVLHLAMAATDVDFQGQGLFGGLMKEWQSQTNDGRWDIAVAECTSPISRYMLRDKFGWTEEKVVPFSSFEVEGTRPFFELDGEVALVYKKL
ncbi:hypothetical protein CVT24_005537 [Panaeolus cyanescens]|uniref:N-acetyltransferase domain-containing protein n=1 Tax=Panaeolus cyanescens TaxID=181874 RepID=A0A409VQP2_9AGAR|nr:hypothetical protein CVT24_005537 [Panaeolus cyanescens]